MNYEHVIMITDETPIKLESDSHDFISTPTCTEKSIVDLTHKPDCKMSKNLSLLRSFSKYTPDSNKSKRNISIPTPAKVEEPIQISGIDRKEKSEAGIHGLTESRFELGHDSQVIPISFKHQMDEIVKKG